MSLKFLAKKSWNVTNLNNVEKVWLAEQAAEKERKKLKELEKQITEERQIQELRELQVKSGQAVKTVDTTLDWMYEGPAAQAEQTSEEYLLGKIYKPKNAEDNAVKETGANTSGLFCARYISDICAAKQPGSLWLNKVSSKNDTFTRLHEDPMLAMKKREKEARENVVNNPVKMARIRHQLAQDVERIEAKKKKKEEKKLLKRKKKEEKKNKRDEGSSDDGRRAERRTFSRSRSRSRSKDRNRRSGDKAMSSRHRSRDRSRENKRQRTEDRRLYGNDDTRFNSSRRRGRSRSRSRSTDAFGRTTRRSPSRSHSRSKTADNLSRSSKDEKSLKRDNRLDDSHEATDKKYGLQSHSNLAKAKTGGDYLGPSKDLLQKKANKEKAEAEARREAVAKARSGQHKKLTEEEKKKRIAEMQLDAETNDQMRLQRQLSKRTGSNVSKMQCDETSDSVTSKGAFLSKMRSAVYNGAASETTSLSETMSRNKHYQQKGEDLDSHGFMKR